MATLAIRFRYLTGLTRELFRNARLVGSWDGSGRSSAVWSEAPMTSGRAEDGCPCFVATVNLDAAEVGTRFRWGVRLDGPSGSNIWGIPTEIPDMNSMERYREFTLSTDEAARDQDFYLTYARRLGARGVLRRPLPGRRPAVRGLGRERHSRRRRVRKTRQRLHQ